MDIAIIGAGADVTPVYWMFYH